MATSLSACGPHLTRFLGTIGAHNPNGILIGSAVFAQMTVECPYTLQWDCPLPPKLPLPMGDLDPHLIPGTWFPGPTRVLNPNGISFSRFCRLTSVTDRSTDYTIQLVTIDRIYVRSTAMRLKN